MWKVGVAMVNESIVYQAYIRESIQHFASKISLEKFTCMPAIRDVDGGGVVILDNTNVPVTGLIKEFVYGCELVWIDVNQDALTQYEVKFFRRLKIENGCVVNLNALNIS